MISEEQIKEAFGEGAPITCATCRHYHAGWGHCGQDCGGPPSGRDFPAYNGDIPRELFIERCLICGKGGPSFIITTGANMTRFGLCEEHKDVFDHVIAQDGPARKVTILAVP